MVRPVPAVWHWESGNETAVARRVLGDIEDGQEVGLSGVCGAGPEIEVFGRRRHRLCRARGACYAREEGRRRKTLESDHAMPRMDNAWRNTFRGSHRSLMCCKRG